MARSSTRDRVLRDARVLLARTGAIREQEDRPDPVAWVEAALDLQLDEWQRRVMRSSSQALLCLCARQVGKSTICGARAAYDAAAFPGQQSIVVGPTYRQARLLNSKIAHVLRARSVPFSAVDNELRLENGSTIISLPGDAPDQIRGFTVSRRGALIVDEAAYVKKSLWGVVLPMLAATGGRLACLTSPAGPSGTIYDMSHDSEVETICVKATELPRFDQSLIGQLRGRLGEHRARMELDAEFGQMIGGIFSPEVLAAMFAKRPPAPEVEDDEPDIAARWERDRRAAVRTRERAIGIPFPQRTA